MGLVTDIFELLRHQLFAAHVAMKYSGQLHIYIYTSYLFLDFVLLAGYLACFSLPGIYGTQERSLPDEISPTLAAGI